jgi:hypothetical protein
VHTESAAVVHVSFAVQCETSVQSGQASAPAGRALVSSQRPVAQVPQRELAALVQVSGDVRQKAIDVHASH